MNRFAEIDNFLRYFAKLYQQNPKLEINDNTIYYALKKYNIMDKNIDPVNNFSFWIDEFRDSKNLMVFHDSRQARFLQFRSTKKMKSSRCFKLYLSYSADNIYDSVTNIFKFIDKNQITSLSKVADYIRSDDVVLRLGDYSEALSVINYVNSDPKLSNDANLPNPFIYRCGKVGVAYDDLLSYNDVVSVVISNYFNIKRSNNDLENVSLSNFYNFVKQFYQNNIQNAVLVNDFVNSNTFHILKGRHIDNAKALINMEQVLKTLLLSLNPQTTVNDIFNNIVQFQDDNNYYTRLNYYNNVLRNDFSRGNVQVNIKTIFDEYINFAINNYGYEITVRRIKLYIEGNRNVITRQNNFRYLFGQYIGVDEINIITNNDIGKYISTNFQNSIKPKVL